MLSNLHPSITSRPLVKADLGIEWRTSPFLPIESLSARQYSLLQLLATAHAQQLQLAPLVHSFADEHRRRFRWRLRKLSGILRNEPDLATALRMTPNVLPDSVVTAIEFGTKSNCLSTTFDQLLLTEAPKNDDVAEKWYSILGYGLFVLPTFGTISVGYCVFIAPTMHKMMEEFELTMPALTTPFYAMIFTVVPWLLPALVISIFAYTLYCTTPIQRWVHFVFNHWFPGPWSPQSRRTNLQLLALTQLANQPLVQSLEILANSHQTPLIRRRLGGAIKRIERGNSDWPSLASERLLPRTLADCLQSLPNQESRSFVLLEAAKLRHNSERKRSYVGMTLLQSFTTLFFAILVLWACWVCFAPIIVLIRGLANAY